MAAIKLCSSDETPAPGQVRRFAVADLEVALVNLGAQGLRVIDAVCSHALAYLDEGEVDTEARTIGCPRHGSVFHLDTGGALSLPATKPVRVFPVTIDGDDILIEV